MDLKNVLSDNKTELKTKMTAVLVCNIYPLFTTMNISQTVPNKRHFKRQRLISTDGFQESHGQKTCVTRKI